MEKKKLNRIIDFLREEMMTANPAGGQGGTTFDEERESPGFDVRHHGLFANSKFSDKKPYPG